MKICVVCGGKVKNVCLPECDLAVFSSDVLGDVDYEKELSGKTDKFEDVARLSKAEKCGVFCGCLTDSRGLKRKSVVVADGGKLLGITDMLHVLDGEDVKSGAGIGVYQTGGYKMGVLVGNDIFFPETVKAMSLCACNMLCVYMDETLDAMPCVLIRAYAYLYGMPVVLVSPKCAYFADITGAIASSNQEITVFETDPKNCYRVVTSRRRGLWSERDVDY